MNNKEAFEEIKKLQKQGKSHTQEFARLMSCLMIESFGVLGRKERQNLLRIFASSQGISISMKEEIDLEDHNFYVDSRGWKEITIAGKKYLVNPEQDIWEILEGEFKGQQLFTWDAAMRETTKVGKRMPTDKEFTELLKTKEDMPNPVFAGYRIKSDSFYEFGVYAFFWSSTVSRSGARKRYLDSSTSTVYRTTGGKANGFSVRCIKEQKK